jgi:hypothetical protein
MENSWYSFDLPFGWVLVAFGLSVVVSFLLYSKKDVPWNSNVSILLGVLRVFSVFLIALLLLNPLLRKTVNHVDKPILVFAVDNSESVALRTNPDTLANVGKWIAKATTRLSDKYEVGYGDLQNVQLDSLTFNSKTTNLDQLLSNIQAAYEGERISGVVLLTDGIVNEGVLPQYKNYTFPIYTVGLGDTIAPKDIAIREVMHNAIAYQGNKFPIKIQTAQTGFEAQDVVLKIKEKDQVLVEKPYITSGKIASFDFELEAKEAGLRHLVISISRLDGESTFFNNQKDIYINVVEGKEKVLIVAPAPHPDITAIRKVLAQAANYESDLYIPGVQEKNLDKKYDVVIEHNAFSGMKYPEVSATGKWYILGSRSLPRLNQELSYFKIQQRGRQTDKVRPFYNESFSKFHIEKEKLKALTNFPPLMVAFGDYKTSGPVEVLLNQGVGSVDTGKPMMFYYDDGKMKTAVTAGSGIWQWKLQEASTQQGSPLFDEIVLKTIQLLSVKSDKKQFVVKPRQTSYNENERVFMDVEVYDAIYERVYGNTITLNLVDEKNKTTSIELVDGKNSSSFNLGRMEEGIYKYKAVTNYASKVLTETGEFVVKQTQVEALSLQADHELLRQVSRKSGGDFYDFSRRIDLEEGLASKDAKGVIRSDEDFFPLIKSLWILALIMVLLATEWFFRKYLGAY